MALLFKKTTWLIGLLLFSFLENVLGQGVEKEELVAAYVYSFAKNIEWPDDDNVFRIQVMTENAALTREFKFMAANKNLRGRSIEIISSSSAIVSQQSHLIYISQDFNSVVRSVFLQVRDQNILMVTDEFSDDRFTMINFREAENNTISFEINRANIINQGLKILPEMILLGGTDIDMAQLYREAQDSIQVLESRIGGLQGQYDSLSKDISAFQDQISKQQNFIQNQSDEIRIKQEVIAKQNTSLDSLQRGVIVSEDRLKSLTTRMNEREQSFKELQKSIKKQQDQLDEGRLVLEEQFRLIEEQDELISERETSLEKMVSVVSSQKRTVILLVLFSVVVVGFLIVVYRAYKFRRDHARELSAQRDELRKLLNELQQAQTQLVQSEKMASLGVLTAGIAHEINNAINFVASGIHVLEQNLKQVTPVINKVRKLKKDDENLHEQIDKLIDVKDKVGYNDIQKMIKEVVKNIKVGAERTTEIVKGLRTFSVSDSETLTKVDVKGEVEVALLLLNNKIKGRINLVHDFDPQMEPIDGYKGQLGQVFLNILGNAVDALENSDNPEISIKATQTKNQLRIEIADNGPGIRGEHMDRIFDPFYTTKKIGVGTGLGLSIAYGIIEQHKGTISVSSEPGKGATFTILLPLKIAQ